MRKILLVISTILVINSFVGYLFQVHKQVICIPEIIVLCTAGLVFWMLAYKPLHFITTSINYKVPLTAINLSKIGIIGILIIGLNLIFCFYFLKASMIIIYGCDSSSFKILNISLTNNITGNILCYSSLIYLFIHDKVISTEPRKDNDKKEIFVQETVRPSNESIKRETINDFIFILNYKNTMVKVNLSTISHIMVEKNCSIIHSLGRKFVKYESLKSLKHKLPNDQFLRIHRSTIVNLNFIEELINLPSGDGMLNLKNGVALRFSRNYRKALIEQLRTGQIK